MRNARKNIDLIKTILYDQYSIPTDNKSEINELVIATKKLITSLEVTSLEDRQALSAGSSSMLAVQQDQRQGASNINWAGKENYKNLQKNLEEAFLQFSTVEQSLAVDAINQIFGLNYGAENFVTVARCLFDKQEMNFPELAGDKKVKEQGATENDSILRAIIEHGTAEQYDGELALALMAAWLHKKKEEGLFDADTHKKIGSALFTAMLSNSIEKWHDLRDTGLKRNPVLEDALRYVVHDKIDKKEDIMLYKRTPGASLDSGHYTSLLIKAEENGTFTCSHHDTNNEHATVFRNLSADDLRAVIPQNNDALNDPWAWREKLAEKKTSLQQPHQKQVGNSCHTMALWAPIEMQYLRACP